MGVGAVVGGLRKEKNKKKKKKKGESGGGVRCGKTKSQQISIPR
jgi:hypothetical protein